MLLVLFVGERYSTAAPWSTGFDVCFSTDAEFWLKPSQYHRAMNPSTSSKATLDPLRNPFHHTKKMYCWCSLNVFFVTCRMYDRILIPRSVFFFFYAFLPAGYKRYKTPCLLLTIQDPNFFTGSGALQYVRVNVKDTVLPDFRSILLLSLSNMHSQPSL